MMEAKLTFGEYMRRLRRGRKWSLNLLAEKTGLNYPHLSRMENDSTLPRADTVAKLAEALNGDLKIMLELADCLPQTILDRIMGSQEDTAKSHLKRTAGPTQDPDEQQSVNGILDLALGYGLSPEEAQSVIKAFEVLVNMDGNHRAAIVSLIHSFAAGGDDGNA